MNVVWSAFNSDAARFHLKNGLCAFGVPHPRVSALAEEHTAALWHLDFHHGSRKVLTRAGTWETPMLLGTTIVFPSDNDPVRSHFAIS